MCALINLRQKPVSCHTGKYIPLCINLESILNIPVAELFPLWMYKIKTTFSVIEISASQLTGGMDALKQFPDPQVLSVDNDEFKQTENERLTEAMDIALYKLTPRQETIIRMRFGMMPDNSKEFTLDEIATEFDLSRARIGQFIESGIRKLKHDTSKDIFRDLVSDKILDEKKQCRP